MAATSLTSAAWPWEKNTNEHFVAIVITAT